MKVLIIRCYPSVVNINGYNLQEIGLARGLIKLGHECDIVYYSNEEKENQEIKVEENKSITIYWIKGKNILGNVFYNGLTDSKFIKRYDIIQLSEYNQWFSYYFSKKCNVPTVIYHGPYECDFNKKFKIKIKIFDFLFLKQYKKLNPYFISKSKLATEFLTKRGFTNVKTIGVGLDTANFSITTESNMTIDEDRIRNKKMLLYIGVIDERRNILFMLEVFKEVLKLNEQVVLTIIGKGKKEYINKLKKFIEENDMTNNILYYEYVEQTQIKKIYNMADLFILPTNYEIFGMVLLEAMYFGVPVLSSYNGGTSVLVENNITGFINKNFDIKEWSKNIWRLLDDEKLLKKVGQQGSKLIKEKYLWEELASEFVNYYSEVVKKYNEKSNLI